MRMLMLLSLVVVGCADGVYMDRRAELEAARGSMSVAEYLSVKAELDAGHEERVGNRPVLGGLVHRAAVRDRFGD